MTTTKNLWHRSDSAYSPKEFKYAGPCLFEHRGVQVFKNPAGSWDYTFAGATIMQRAGFTRTAATGFIDEVLDGAAPTHESVKQHVNTHGHHAISYADYSELFKKGLAA